MAAAGRMKPARTNLGESAEGQTEKIDHDRAATALAPVPEISISGGQCGYVPILLQNSDEMCRYATLESDWWFL